MRDQEAKYGALKFVLNTWVNDSYAYDFRVINMGNKEELSEQAEYISNVIINRQALVRMRKK